MESFLLFLRLSRPLFLLGGILLYALGGGIAHYLGVAIDWNIYLLGQAWVTVLQLSTQFLNEYYNAPADQGNPNRTFLTGGSGALGPGKLPRRVALMSAFACLAVVASLTVLLIALNRLAPVTLLIMVLAFFGAIFYSTPPVKLEGTGYGELTTSVMVAFLLPSFAYSLQAGDLHKLIPMAAFPLTLLHLAMLIAFELPDYGTDMKYEKHTLLVRMGWQNGMLLHNIIVMTAYIVLGLAVLYGLPWFAAFPAYLSLPLGLLQIWLIYRIGQGAKPSWWAITLNGLATFTSMAYLLTFAFWTH